MALNEWEFSFSGFLLSLWVQCIHLWLAVGAGSGESLNLVHVHPCSLEGSLERSQVPVPLTMCFRQLDILSI